ncbi:ABC transporter substrate-binding protein [Sedimenticola sp.]|uniref:ABC transporter substrate-binding protein n=1 Tax=Sedimenticola sp. TaxID=1940285 RepID=UPI00258D4401|nr:ABC transporter substrate binding protein [Sedimenticola sp.]MCW8904270.1 hypothetical protein [Sedimenticola sp.]
MTCLNPCLGFDFLPISVWYRWGVFSVFLYALSLLLIPPCNAGEQDSVVVFSSGSAPAYTQVARKLKSHLKKECTDISPACSPLQVFILKPPTDGSAVVIPPHTRLIITLGQRAGEEMRDINNGIPILHALIPVSAYQQIDKNKQHSAIYLDQPISRLLQLARVIRADPHIGLLISPLTKTLQDELITEAIRQNIPVSYRNVSSTAMVGHLLKEVLEESNILLALPDPMIFNSTTIFNILLSSYHNKIPVIGFSSAYVKAGALIAAYSTPEDIARHLAEYIDRFLSSGAETLPEPMYPKYFSVSVNHSVARSLGISLPDETDIIRRMLEDIKP